MGVLSPAAAAGAPLPRGKGLPGWAATRDFRGPGAPGRQDFPALLGLAAPAPNSLRSLRSLRSDNGAESEHVARLRRAGCKPCAARRFTRALRPTRAALCSQHPAAPGDGADSGPETCHLGDRSSSATVSPAEGSGGPSPEVKEEPAAAGRWRGTWRGRAPAALGRRARAGFSRPRSPSAGRRAHRRVRARAGSAARASARRCGWTTRDWPRRCGHRPSARS